MTKWKKMAGEISMYIELLFHLAFSPLDNAFIPTRSRTSDFLFHVQLPNNVINHINTIAKVLETGRKNALLKSKLRAK